MVRPTVLVFNGYLAKLGNQSDSWYYDCEDYPHGLQALQKHER